MLPNSGKKKKQKYKKIHQRRVDLKRKCFRKKSIFFKDCCCCNIMLLEVMLLQLLLLQKQEKKKRKRCWCFSTSFLFLRWNTLKQFIYRCCSCSCSFCFFFYLFFKSMKCLFVSFVHVMPFKNKTLRKRKRETVIEMCVACIRS